MKAGEETLKKFVQYKLYTIHQISPCSASAMLLLA